jgi:hypothetical protein
VEPNEIVAHLGSLTRALDELVAEYRQLGEDAAAKRRDYKKAKAAAYLSADGSIVARQAVADLAAADAGFEADVADARVAATKEAIRVLHARIDVGRTVTATLRDEMKLAGQGG